MRAKTINYDILFRAAIFMAGFLIAGCSAGGQNQQKPNIILIMLDDVSPDVYGCYGEPGAANTPVIDQLAREGVMFETCYASSLCAPTRAMIMTGRYGTTTGVLHNNMWLGNTRGDVYKDNHAFGKLLKDAGYATAIAGKWHAGAQMPYEPEVGFDEYCLWEGGAEFAKAEGSENYQCAWRGDGQWSRYWHPAIVKNHQYLETKPDDFGPDIFCEFILDFMGRKVKEDQPFLAYWPSVAPHGCREGITTTPHRGPTGVMTRSETEDEKKARWIALNEYIDHLVGQVVNKVEELGIKENTYVILLSDNGTAVTAKSRGVERGVHVMNICWGGQVKQRGATAELTDFSDIGPTLCEIAGIEMPEASFDGVSLKSFLNGEKDTHRDWIYGYIGTTRLIRTKEYMIEAINPMLGSPEGRFYLAGNDRFGHTYKKINDHPDYLKDRAELQVILDALPDVVGDNPWWKTGKGMKVWEGYSEEKAVNKHLYNHKDYKYYEE